jgi:glycosyltransferase involved in cell wall biosynthesis
MAAAPRPASQVARSTADRAASERFRALWACCQADSRGGQDGPWRKALIVKPVILTSLCNYLPGYKAGGPLRTICNLVQHLAADFEFKLLTADRDLGDTEPYPNIAADRWHDVAGVLVHYTSPGSQSLRDLAKILRDTPHDLLYLNGFFSPRVTGIPLIARRLGMIPRRPVVVAPRGEFSEGAMELKTWKKRPYIMTAKMLGLYEGVIWQASSRHEADDITRVMGVRSKDLHVAGNLSSGLSSGVVHRTRSADAPFRIVFLSRISPMKNLGFAVECLSRVQVPVAFCIYGPAEDAAYWSDCQQKIARLPDHVRVCYQGAVGPSEVPRIMAAHDLFFLPTRGENYGHVIVEAMCAGTPVLISDTTPWRGLAAEGVGRDLPLCDPKAYADYITALSRLGADEYARLRSTVLAYARKMLEENDDVERSKALFRKAIARHDGTRHCSSPD